MSRRERKNKEVREMFVLFLVFVIAMSFVLGTLFGQITTIHNCYMVAENTEEYILNFNGMEYVYLKGESNGD